MQFRLKIKHLFVRRVKKKKNCFCNYISDVVLTHNLNAPKTLTDQKAIFKVWRLRIYYYLVKQPPKYGESSDHWKILGAISKTITICSSVFHFSKFL